MLLFFAFALGFAIKVPMWPFHTWLPDAHVEAPTAGSVILAGILLKLGTYGFFRFNLPMFPAASADQTYWGGFGVRNVMIVLAIIGIIYGALAAMYFVVKRDGDVKKLVAYSSVSSMGIVILGLFALNPNGLNGAVLHMINHGIYSGALFLLVGIIYERRHTRVVSEFGGLSHVMPGYAAVFLAMAMTAIGLPLLCVFISEFLAMRGAFEANPWWAAWAALGIILNAGYMLWLYQRMFFGNVENPKNRDAARPQPARVGLHAPARRALALDRRLPRAVPALHREAGQRRRPPRPPRLPRADRAAARARDAGAGARSEEDTATVGTMRRNTITV